MECLHIVQYMSYEIKFILGCLIQRALLLESLNYMYKPVLLTLDTYG